MSFRGQTNIWQKVAAKWAGLAVISCRLLKKPLLDFNFLHIFAIPSKSEHKKRCQLLDRLFEVFQHSKNMQCFGHYWTILDTFGHSYPIKGLRDIWMIPC